MRRYTNYRPSSSSVIRLRRILGSLLSSAYQYAAQELVDERRLFLEVKSRPRASPALLSAWARKRFLTVSNVLLLIWALSLYWGEVTVFKGSIEACSWDAFEHWRENAIPHRLVLVTDPQLVDPHTYPGRPWPLSTLTVKHTDLYLRRSYSRIQKDLDPNTIIFLGDMFDGGREWATRRSKSPDTKYHKYKDHFWQKEFNRFGRIFFRSWRDDKRSNSTSPATRRIIATMPGNHDLGFGSGIQKPVRDRYNGYFGEGNRIDIIGNHTFVSLDTVSLSAKEQDTSAVIWGPTDDFLQGFTTKKDLAISRFLGILHDRRIYETRPHGVSNITDRNADSFQSKPPVYRGAYFPNVLLSHIPLFRNPGTPCGPLRERYPPSSPPPGQNTPLEVDEPNAIPYAAGYQYQNVLTHSLSAYILRNLNDDVEFAFSGDDHDYCEVLHQQYPRRGSGLREITVKSLSWAMGVKRPGFLMVSLWNPVTDNGQRASRYNTPTMKTQLCLLPNQIAIFLRYALLAGITVVILLLKALYILRHPEKYPPRIDAEYSILPMFRNGSSQASLRRSVMLDAQSELPYGRPRTNTGDSTSAFSSEEASMYLSARNGSNTRPRSISPEPTFGGNFPSIGTVGRQSPHIVSLPLGGYAEADQMDKKYEDSIPRNYPKWRRKEFRKVGRVERLLREWASCTWRVAWKAMLCYVWFLQY